MHHSGRPGGARGLYFFWSCCLPTGSKKARYRGRLTRDESSSELVEADSGGKRGARLSLARVFIATEIDDDFHDNGDVQRNVQAYQ